MSQDFRYQISEEKKQISFSNSIRLQAELIFNAGVIVLRLWRGMSIASLGNSVLTGIVGNPPKKRFPKLGTTVRLHVQPF